MQAYRLIITFFILITILLYGNILSYLQDYLIGTQIINISYIRYLMILLFLIQIGYIMLSKKIKLLINKKIAIPYLFWMIYTIISMVLLYRFDYNPIYPIYSLYMVMVYPIIFFVLVIAPPLLQKTSTISDIRKEKLLFLFYYILSFIAVPVILFGWVQFFAKNTIVQLTKNDQNLMVETGLLGSFRPPSIYGSSLDFGLLCVFIFILSLAYAIHKKNNIFTWIITLVALSGILISQTRNVYLYAFFALLTLILIFINKKTEKNKNNRILFLLPIIYTMITIVIIFYGVYKYLNSPLEGLADTSTTVSRVYLWFSIYEKFIADAQPMDLLFGYGLLQHTGTDSLSSIIPDITNLDNSLAMDNAFLSIFMYQGIIGLSFFITVYYLIWVGIMKISINNKPPFIIGITAFLSGYFPACLLNVLNMGYWSYITLFFALTILVLYYNNRRSLINGNSS